MGTWDVGIFDNDIAIDIRNAIKYALVDGAEVAEAQERVLSSYASALEDTDDGPIIYLTLAALGVEYGVVLADVRERALEIITSGQDRERWGVIEQEKTLARKQILEELRAKLS